MNTVPRTNSTAPVSEHPTVFHGSARNSFHYLPRHLERGKTTLCKQLATNLPGLWHSISYTTRKPRPSEEHGREYYFIGEQAFREMIARNEFVEWAHVYGHLYGTPRKSLTEKIDQGIDVLLEIDVQGPCRSETIRRFGVDLYSSSLDDVLRARLKTRASDTAEEIQGRLNK